MDATTHEFSGLMQRLNSGPAVKASLIRSFACDALHCLGTLLARALPHALTLYQSHEPKQYYI